MDTQLSLSNKKLKDIGFTYNNQLRRFIIPVTNGFIYYNPKEKKYKWYLRMAVGNTANDIHLDIWKEPILFILLQALQVKHNF